MAEPCAPEDGLHLLMSTFLRSAQAPLNDEGRCIQILLTCWCRKDIEAHFDAALDHARAVRAYEKEAA